VLLEEDHRIVVLDAGDQQSLGVVRVRRHDHFEAGDVREPGMQALRMLRALAPAAADQHADGQRYLGLPAEHVVPLGGLVADLLERSHREFEPNV
jgi:hypothetical protein